MKTIFRLFVLALLLAGWSLAGMSLHVVRTPDRIALVPKDRIAFEDTYVDTRFWTLDDAAKHHPLLGRLVATDRADLLRHIVGGSHKVDMAAELRDVLDRPEVREEPKGDATTGPSTAARQLWSELWR